MLLLLCAAAGVSAEEFHLIDGSKVSGTIVGFDGNAFRVQTQTRIVVVPREQIRRIVFYPQSLDPGAARVRSATRAAPVKNLEPPPEVSAAPRPASPPPMAAGRLPRPVPPPKPEKMVEHIGATYYANESFSFRMYKPPSWRSYPRFVKPDNPLLAALGTPDETTLLLVGQEIFEGDLPTYVRLAEDSLRELYPDYRKTSEIYTRFAGFPALERHFTGTAEGHFWTGLAIYFSHGDSYYTFLGLTSEKDLLSFQQSLLRKVINTVEFGTRR